MALRIRERNPALWSTARAILRNRFDGYSILAGDDSERALVLSTAVTAANNETYTIKIGSRSISFTSDASGTQAEVIAGLIAAWLASPYPEFKEVTPSDGTTALIMTANTAGRPFEISVSSSPAGSKLGAASTVTSNKSPNDINVAENWYNPAAPTVATLPVNGDTIVFDGSAKSDALWNLGALSSVALASIVVKRSFRHRIGLPRLNESGQYGSYTEYRQGYLVIGATTVSIGDGEGPGSDRIKINTGVAASTHNVYASASPAEQGIPSVLLLANHASYVLNVYGGVVGYCFFEGESGSAPVIRVGSVDGGFGTARLYVGSGATLTAVFQDGGHMETLSAIGTSLAVYSGSHRHTSGTLASATVQGGTLDWEGGNITTLHVGSEGFLDCSGGMVARTATTTTADPGAKINDPFAAITWTNGINTSGGRLNQFDFNFGIGRTYTPSA